MASHLTACESTDSRSIEFVRKGYEEIGAQEAEPTERWERLVVRLSCSKWHIRITFHGTLQSSAGAFPKWLKRRDDLRDLCLCIDFKQLQLLDNTVTELLITHSSDTESYKLPLLMLPDADNGYATSANLLCVSLQEDPLRVRFPLYRPTGSAPAIEFSGIKKMQFLTYCVYEALVDGDQTLHVYKEIERDIYQPTDSEVLEQELRNLQLLRGTEGIAWLVAAVISKNPYQTIDNESSTTVLRGILLKHYPNGTLKSALQSPKPQMDGRWLVWGIQIAEALACIHKNGLTHMDLKPSNIVINAEWSAVVIDISGIGGVTNEWLSPTLQKEYDPLSQCLEVRKQNDIWALGKIISAMAEVSTSVDKELLKSVGWAAMQVPASVSLTDVISRLSPKLSE
ncbi:kinase-like domain-containing protein [Hypoxylon argillaceum]|nr:kinase-like domain-containing protein [Hypoxylon argillaceum]